MTRSAPLVALAGALLAGAVALGQESPGKPKPAVDIAGAPPVARKPGPEVEALKRVIRDYTFQGHIPAGMLWKDSPEAPSHGFWDCEWILSGLWASCEMLDVMGPVKDGKGLMADGRTWTWRAQYFFGWDYAFKIYRMAGVDNAGDFYSAIGRVEGSKFIFEVPEYRIAAGGIEQRFRFVFDYSDPNTIKFHQDNMVRGDPTWRPGDVETYIPTREPH